MQPRSSNQHIIRMWRIAVVLTCILCLGPAILFTLRQFHESREIMEHHVDTLERVLNSPGMRNYSAGLNEAELAELIRDALEAPLNFALFDEGVLVAAYRPDERFPVVSTMLDFHPGNGRTLLMELSMSLSDNLPLLIGVAAGSLVTMISLLYFLRRNIYLRWKALNVLEQNKQAKLELISELGSDWIWSTAPDHCIKEFTEKPGSEMLALGMAGRRLWDLPHLVPDRSWTAIIKTMDDQQSMSCRIRCITNDNPLYLEFMAKPNFGINGRFDGYVGIIKDISYVLERERVFEDEKSRLTRMVDQRSVDLLQAKVAAEQANLTKSRFLSTMSHEIRTPLNAIIGLTNLLLKTPLNFKQREYVETVINSSELLLGIINDILDLSKIEAGNYELIANEFSLSDLLNDVTDLVRQRAQAKRLELIYDIDAPLLEHKIIADQKRLSQALLNYLSNAIKFTDTGHIVIKVAMQDQAAIHDNGRLALRFSVKDTGIGITPKDQEKLFSLFSQVDNTYTRKFEGTGLGLYIVKNIARLMQGEAGMTSKPGYGSTFWFSAVVEQGAPVIDRSESADSSFLNDARILIVDDNDDTRTVLHAGLSRAGARVTCVASGDLAITMVKDNDASGEPFAAVLMDWLLVGGSGVQVARSIRSLPLSLMPVILCLSARDLSEMPADEQDAFNYSLAKPVDINALKTMLIRLCSSNTATNPAANAIVDSAAVSGMHSFARPVLVGKRALLVDDDRISLKLAEYILSSNGMSCVTCMNGREALSILERDDSFEYILIDLEMPELDGASTVNLIRTMPSMAAVRIIVITAHALESEVESIRQLEVDGVLTKPYGSAQLLNLLETYGQASEAGEHEGASEDEAKALKVLRDIHARLRDGDPMAREISVQNTEMLKGALQEGFSAYERAIINYDFETAMAVVGSTLVKWQQAASQQTPDSPELRECTEPS